MDGVEINGTNVTEEFGSTISEAGSNSVASLTGDQQNPDDGLLSHENEELRDRVAALEKKVLQQEDDLICLKSALSDCLRRLASIESNKGSVSSKSSSRTPARRSTGLTSNPGHPSSARKALLNDSTAARHASPSHSRASSNKTSGGAPSSASSAASSTAGSVKRMSDLSPGVTSNSVREPVFKQGENMTHSAKGHYRKPKLQPLKTPTAILSRSPLQSIDNDGGLCDAADNREVFEEVGRVESGELTPVTPLESPRILRSAKGSGKRRIPRRSVEGEIRGNSYNIDEGSMRFFLRGRSLTFYGPTNMVDYDFSATLPAPNEKLKLEWAYGYRGRDARCNLYLLPTGEMVYFIAGIVVLYNVEEQMQRHYTGHTDDVKCLAVHPDKITIASGQVAGHDRKEGKWSMASRKKDKYAQPHIRIWDSVSLNTLRIIGLGDFDRAVACVAFSKADGGQYIVAVDEANEHIISLWDWQKGEKGHRITETKSSTEPVLAAEFHPCERNVIVTCGKNQISFWSIDGGTLSRKQGIFERHDKPKYVTCLAFAENGDVISGDSNGNLFIWGREAIEEGNNRITQAVTGAHEGGIFSICVMKDGTIVTGGKDRRIVEWSAVYKRTGREHELPEQFGSVRMLSQGKGSSILCGTTKNCVLQGSLDLKFSAIVQGHMEETWGLATHPNQHQFASCAYDHTLYMWDALAHTPVWTMQLGDGGHCVCFHPEGTIMVVGTQTPRWMVIDMTTREIVATLTDGSEQIECVTFSPDGKQIALGSRDNYIYVYHVSDGGRKYTRTGRCSGHSSFVTHVDWSVDGEFLQSNSGDYEVLFWSAANCQQITSASSLRDVQWATHSCTLGFNTCGIWPEGADGTDVNTCSRSNKHNLIATADDFGKVNLYSYPCHLPKAQGNVYGGHSSHVTNVQFIHDDSRLISTGGKDMAVFQWEILR